MALLEIAIDSLPDAVQAAASGADRLEVCSDLRSGGLTPSPDMFASVRKEVDLPLFVMIRPRPGDFFHSAPESELLIRQVTGFTTIGADGFVFGCLLQDRSVDMPLTRRLVEEAGELPCTIHRAFDEVRDHRRAIEDLVECGAARILTSGGASTAVEGAGNLRSFVEQAAGRLIILPGGGVRPDNAEYILHETSAAELHSAARSESGVFDPMIARLLAGITHSSNSRTGRKTGTMPGEDFSKT